MKKIICLFIDHNYLDYFPGNALIVRECKRCGHVYRIHVWSVSGAVDFFKNYDKAIAFCQKNPIVYERDR